MGVALDINKLNNSIKDIIELSNGGIESFVIYNKEDGLVITGENIDYEKSAIYHSIFGAAKTTSTNFKFSNGINGYSIVLKNKKMIYSSTLAPHFIFTAILDLTKIQLGYFKGILLKNFLENNSN